MSHPDPLPLTSSGGGGDDVRAGDAWYESGGSVSLGSGDWWLEGAGVASPGSFSGAGVGLLAARLTGEGDGDGEAAGGGGGSRPGAGWIPTACIVFCTHSPHALGLALPVIAPRAAERASASTAAMTIGRIARRAADTVRSGLDGMSIASSSCRRRRANSCSKRLSTSCIVNKTRTPPGLGTHFRVSMGQTSLQV